MRKLIYVISLSIDGYCDHTIGVPDDEVFDFYINLIRNAGLSVYGRKTYELMVPYWPDIAKNPEGQTKADVDYAEAFDAMEKIVFSKSLEKTESRNWRIVRTNPEDEIIRLKQEEGSNILVGGISLATYLVERGLVDEYILQVMPIIVGSGRRLFEGINLPGKLNLKLLETRIFKSGALLHRYAK